MLTTSQQTRESACKVLLIDDSHDFVILIQALLADPGIILTVTTNGAEGVQAFKEGQFDLVLMDLLMPEMSGFEATRQIRDYERQHRLRPTPITALTASTSASAISEIYQAGCSHYLPKPVTRNVLLQTIGQYFAASRKSPKASAPLLRTTSPHV